MFIILVLISLGFSSTTTAHGLDARAYVASIDTDGLNAGDYEGIIVAEKSGFETSEGGFEFTLSGGSTPPSEPTPNGTTGGIPGCPSLH